MVELIAGEPRTVRRSRDSGAGHAVATVLETWRIDDEWWRQPISRCYYEVVLESGKRAVVFEDMMTGEWFEQKP